MIKVKRIKKDGESKIYQSVAEAAKDVGVPKNYITEACSSRSYKVKGYLWSYIKCDSLPTEEWKFHPIYPFEYSTEGRARNKNGRLIKGSLSGCYKRHDQMIKGKVHHHAIHRRILETFTPRIDSDILYCDHINEDKQDNRLCNLQWVTPKENTFRYHENARRRRQLEKDGKLTERTVGEKT
jgi:hypothetical protein